ncbi:cytochrome P450 [Actinomadura rupiterrae]|uniref:cytochrome P450 n=1 Tax=Actinomadura rupiterrae TaxID=559627 RepID=UPI0020A50326|nr:cytochrome P450 [Actinomadura rupiterrae]MCP2341574.1 cytochrome P450 [Actinomadura rupiterrae]
MPSSTEPPRVQDIDLADLTFWQRPAEQREKAFRRLREQPGPVFFPMPAIPFLPRSPGFWALTRHADVTGASRLPEVFSSEPNATTPVDLPDWLNRYVDTLLNMDDPRHAKVRRTVSRAFAPRVLTRLHDTVRERSEKIVDDLVRNGPGDFVAAAAVRLPIEVISEMLGVPERHYQRIVARTNVLLGFSDEEYTTMSPAFGRVGTGRALLKVARAGRDLHSLAADLGRERVRRPTGDLTSALVNADVDGERLSPREFGAFFLLLVLAGNETTRNAIAHGLKLFTDHPEQRELLMEDFDARIGGAVEEVVRFSSPVISFRRNVVRDHELNGHRYREGDQVMLFYSSANRDDAVFEQPDSFDISRHPNPHVGFGGPGPHFCLGANLARLEITEMFRALYTRLPTARSVGDPDMLRSYFMNGVKRIRIEFDGPVPRPRPAST